MILYYSTVPVSLRVHVAIVCLFLPTPRFKNFKRSCILCSNLIISGGQSTGIMATPWVVVCAHVNDILIIIHPARITCIRKYQVLWHYHYTPSNKKLKCNLTTKNIPAILRPQLQLRSMCCLVRCCCC